MMIENTMNREFKTSAGGNPYAAAMSAAYALPGKYDEKDFQLPPALLSLHNVQAAYYSSRMQVPAAAYGKPMWRKGKWLDEEEAYTKKLIEAFNNGYLNISSGTTLRSFLSERLSCDPMRITKKFAGSSCIGKQVYTPCDIKTIDQAVVAKIQDELKELEEKFRAKVDVQRALDYYPLATPATFAPLHPAAFHAPRMAYLDGIPPEYYAALPAQGPLPHMMPNPFMMKMYANQEIPISFMYPHPPTSTKCSPKYNPADMNSEYRTDGLSIPVVPVANLKSKASRSSDEMKGNDVPSSSSAKKSKSEKRQKTSSKSETRGKPSGVQGDLDASDLLLNFFKAANESIDKSRSNSCVDFETAKFEDKSPKNSSTASISSSTLTSASNLAGMISSASSEADNEYDVIEEDETDSTSLLTKRKLVEDYLL